MRLERISSDEESGTVTTYSTECIIYGLAFSQRVNKRTRLALATLKQTQNQVSIRERFGNNLMEIGNINHEGPPSKVMFCPTNNTLKGDLLATSRRWLKIWQIGENYQVKGPTILKSDSQFNGPIASFDWNQKNIEKIVSASIDSTVSIWDIEKEAMNGQFIAHDTEVSYVQFTSNANNFATVGLDGSLRLHDCRDFRYSAKFYQTSDRNPLIKLSCNKSEQYGNFTAILEMDKPEVLMIDLRQQLIIIRKPTEVYQTMGNHKAVVNVIGWSTHKPSHFVSGDDEGVAFIWNLSSVYKQQFSKLNKFAPELVYEAGNPFWNMAVAPSQTDLVVFSCGDRIQMIYI